MDEDAQNRNLMELLNKPVDEKIWVIFVLLSIGIILTLGMLVFSPAGEIV